jgi:hypothetical protein
MGYLMDSNLILYCIILLIYTSLSHGLTLFNDGLYWDSWMVDSWQRRKDWHTMKRYLSEVGMPIMYYVYKLNSYFPNRIFASKLLGFISIYFSSVLVYLIATFFEFLNPGQALVISLLFLSYTGYHMMVDTVVSLQYTFPIFVFYLAVFLSLFGFSSNSSESIYFHFMAIILFFWSFNANSILVYYFGFLGFSLLFQANWDLNNLFQTNILINNVFYCLIPFIYWIIKEKFTPRHGYCIQYNKISINPFKIVFGAICALRDAFEASVLKPVFFLIKKRLLIISFLTIILFDLFFSVDFVIDNSTALILLSYGLVLFMLAIIPYLLVGQPINDNGWATKNAMLIHLPAGMIFFGMSSLLITDTFMLKNIIFFYLISTCLYNMRNALYYLAVFVKDYSWLHNLKHKELNGISIFQVIDKHDIKGDFANKYQDYKPVYLLFMFDWIWGETPKKFGISEFEPRQAYSTEELNDAFDCTTIPYALNLVDINSPQVRVVIKNNTNRSYFIYALKYILIKILNKNKQNLNELLEEITSIEIEYIEK